MPLQFFASRISGKGIITYEFSDDSGEPTLLHHVSVIENQQRIQLCVSEDLSSVARYPIDLTKTPSILYSKDSDAQELKVDLQLEKYGSVRRVKRTLALQNDNKYNVVGSRRILINVLLVSVSLTLLYAWSKQSNDIYQGGLSPEIMSELAVYMASLLGLNSLFASLRVRNLAILTDFWHYPEVVLDRASVLLFSGRRSSTVMSVMFCVALIGGYVGWPVSIDYTEYTRGPYAQDICLYYSPDSSYQMEGKTTYRWRILLDPSAFRIGFKKEFKNNVVVVATMNRSIVSRWLLPSFSEKKYHVKNKILDDSYDMSFRDVLGQTQIDQERFGFIMSAVLGRSVANGLVPEIEVVDDTILVLEDSKRDIGILALRNVRFTYGRYMDEIAKDGRLENIVLTRSDTSNLWMLHNFVNSHPATQYRLHPDTLMCFVRILLEPTSPVEYAVFASRLALTCVMLKSAYDDFHSIMSRDSISEICKQAGKLFDLCQSKYGSSFPVEYHRPYFRALLFIERESDKQANSNWIRQRIEAIAKNSSQFNIVYGVEMLNIYGKLDNSWERYLSKVDDAYRIVDRATFESETRWLQIAYVQLLTSKFKVTD